MGRVSNTIREVIGTILDILDILGLSNSVGSGVGIVGTVVAWLHDLPIIYPIAFMVVIAFLGTRMFLNYARWKRLEVLRTKCFDISVVLQKMHNRMTELANKKARELDASKCDEVLEVFVEFTVEYDYGEDILFETLSDIISTTKPFVFRLFVRVKRRLTARHKSKRNKEALTLLVALLDNRNRGLREDLRSDKLYKELESELIDLSKYVTDPRLSDLKTGYLKQSLEWNTLIVIVSCFPLLLDVAGYSQEASKVKIAGTLLPDNMNRIMDKELLKVKKQIEKFWKKG